MNELIRRYRSRGILIDTNVLLLLLRGSADRAAIAKFKRTRMFTETDFETLVEFLRPFQRVVTTPSILTEVSNLAKPGSSQHAGYVAELRRTLGRFRESHVRSLEVVSMSEFEHLGLTDAGIARVARGKYLVLTEDSRLADSLGRQAIDVVNFNHLRSHYILR